MPRPPCLPLSLLFPNLRHYSTTDSRRSLELPSKKGKHLLHLNIFSETIEHSSSRIIESPISTNLGARWLHCVYVIWSGVSRSRVAWCILLQEYLHISALLQLTMADFHCWKRIMVNPNIEV